MFDQSSFLAIISGQKKGVLPSLIRCALSGLTPVYRLGAWIRNRKFAPPSPSVTRAPIPVISIGNLTTGGTGKTPMVVMVAHEILRRGLKPVIVSRGYGKQSDGLNDEARELKNRLPGVLHLQNPNRVASAETAVKQHAADVIIMDDGFQHRFLARDLDMVLIDATQPFGFGRLLPRGLLREPISALSRADMVIITRTESASQERLTDIQLTIARHAPNVPILSAITQMNSWQNSSGDKKSISELESKPTFAFCGIGNPHSFFENLPVPLRGTAIFPDHHHFSPRDLDHIAKQAADNQAELIVCTHKDLVKIGKDFLGELPLFALTISTQLNDPESRFTQAIAKTLNRKRPSGDTPQSNRDQT